MPDTDSAWLTRSRPRAHGRVLLADTDEPTLAVLRHRLERAGLAVEAVDNGPDALDAVRQSPVDVVVAANQLPGLDGVSLLRALRDGDAPAPPVVVVFWPGKDEAVVRAFEAGVADVIVRPLSIAEAGARILRLVPSEAPA